MDPSSSTAQPAVHQPRRTPAKTVDSVVPISAETRAILKRQTDHEYLTSADLPDELSLVDCLDLVDVSAFGTVHTLNLSGCTGIVDVSAL
eukprot:CAMPEP_0174241134 /NCGR_PEP_ID=MMETSP0417-20130205/21945_1 /TAXON_ID=242541 /ORGANISM="Mayorella sp, Strain BSH-02190019" /LENGTH=89 /DNA_ID=CAMNT_0015320333 /DNA_START=129 /DNA_END=394 /DNA_ORIENTATION=-